LTFLLKDWVQTIGGTLSALIVDHGIRSESGVEAKSVAAQLSQRDIPAHILADTLRSSSKVAKDASRRAKSAAAEIAQEELRATPSASEYEDFTQRVRHLSTEVERAAARINKSRQIIEALVASKMASEGNDDKNTSETQS
jgi:ubiquinone biosynthesis protein UbiJ